MMAAAEQEHFEEAAFLSRSPAHIEDIAERQRIASAQGDDTDVLAYYAEPPLVAALANSLSPARGPRRRTAASSTGRIGKPLIPRICALASHNSCISTRKYLPKMFTSPSISEDRRLARRHSFPDARATKWKSHIQCGASSAFPRSRPKTTPSIP